MFVKWMAALGFVLSAATAFAGELGPESNRRDEVYFTEAQARDKVFGAVLDWRDTAIHVDDEMRDELRARTAQYEADSSVHLAFAVDSEGMLIGAYRIASEIGKYLPFEFMVALDSNLRVKDIVVLTYRESRGGEVRRERFVRQYRGKGASDHVSLNRDIIGISGATLSAQAVNRGVKKTLWWAQRLWPGAVAKK